MRLRGSITVENAVIVPLFVIITVSLIMLDLYIHDNLIAKSTALKLGVKAEMELSDYAVMSGADRNIVKKNICDAGQIYAAEKTISMRNVRLEVQDGKKTVSVVCYGNTPDMISRITKKHNVSAGVDITVNSPPGFIRLINAAKNIIG